MLVFGISANTTVRGHLNEAKCFLHHCISSSAVALAPGFNSTKAQGVSPHLSSGLATTAAAATAAPTTTTTVALIPPANIKLLVLNGTLKGVLAGQFTTKLKEMGYQTQTPDNTTKAVDSSTVYAVSSQYSAEAQFLAQQLGLAPGSVVTNVPNDAPISSSEKTIANVILVAGPDLVNKV